MIRVNLLEGTAEHRVAVQKTKVAAKRGQQIFMVGSAALIFLIAAAADKLWTGSAFAAAQSEFNREKTEAAKLAADLKRKEDLEKELKELDERISVIKQLRAEQKGPVAMLSAINERMPAGQVDFRLDSITQKASHLQIIGTTISEQVVADFSRNLEFSNGLFSNLMLTTKSSEVPANDLAERKTAEKSDSDKKDSDKKATEKKPAPEPSTPSTRLVQFTIDCDYNKPRAEADKKAAPGK